MIHYFQCLGVTTNDQWNQQLKKYPGPWGELEIPGHVIITFPSQLMREVTDMKSLAQVYSDVVEAIGAFTGLEKRYRVERFVFDEQIALGNYPLYVLQGKVSIK